jgi:hypothetical protein
LQVKIQAMPHANLATLSSSITVEWDRLAAEFIWQDLPLILLPPGGLVSKHGTFIE